MTNELGKTVSDILLSKYVIPLYQRNFTWHSEEIVQLLQDIYGAMNKNKNGNYYLGSLVVLKRHSGDYEVIDGQQRLTVISVIAILTGKISLPVLSYDSRPEVNEFFQVLCSKGEVEKLSSPTLYYLKEAVEIIRESRINNNPDSNTNQLYIESKEFSNYFWNHVVLVKTEIPEDTDVATYFEIMNNRGEQLQKHEIVKSQMMETIKNSTGLYDINKQKQFARIWDVCSQMDVPIHRLFSPKERNDFFDKDFNSVRFEEAVACERSIPFFTIDDILKRETSTNQDESNINLSIDENEEEVYNYNSIIDFPNFLMHVLKIYLSDNNKEESLNVNLNENELLSIYERNKALIDPMKFVYLLLFCRTAFDRFILKTTEDTKDLDDGKKWVLVKPTRYEKNWKFTQSFGAENEMIIKALSMLQVTFRTRSYKKWLYEVLNWLHSNCFMRETNSYSLSNIKADCFLTTCLHKFINNYYEDNIIRPYLKSHKNCKGDNDCCLRIVDDNDQPDSNNAYSEGTSTPHFLLNFIDYLLWLKYSPNNRDGNFPSDFEFKYWNSVEHHLAQNYVDSDCPYIHNLGNLCLISRSSNSRLSDRSVSEKIDRYKDANMGLNRQLIYYQTIGSNGRWGVKEIQNHYNMIVALLNSRKELLGIIENESNSSSKNDPHV